MCLSNFLKPKATSSRAPSGGRAVFSVRIGARDLALKRAESRALRNHKVPPAYSRAEESARSPNGRRDDDLKNPKIRELVLTHTLKACSTQVHTHSNSEPRLDRSERLVQIGDEVCRVFDTDRDAHHAIGQSNLFTAFLTQSRMRHRGRVRDERFNSSQRLAQRA